MLTGRTRFRSTITGRLVLQVEYRVPAPSPGVFDAKWRDARTQDLAELHELTYSNINITLRLPAVPDELPGERRDPRSTTH